MAVAVNAVVSVDAAGRIIHFNPAAERTFGYRAGEILGKPFLTLLPRPFHEQYRMQLDQLFSTEDASNAGRTIEMVARGSNGEEFPAELCLVTWRSAAGALYTCIVRDVTGAKALELEREELLKRVEAMARTDDLTGLANRRAWDEELRKELARASRRGHKVCAVMLDLDRLKEYNDTYGHQAGDALLSEIGSSWRIALRVTDVLARYGGDEFSLLLPDCSVEAALAVVERLRAEMPGGHTCSAGLACWDGSMTAEELVGRADAALLEAKRAGRDQVVK